MEDLSKNWFSEGHLDFEYKKYVLLAYLSKVSAQFDQVKLYPQLSDLVYHFHNLENIKKKQEFTKNLFPKRIKKINPEEFEIEYENTHSINEEIEQLMEIVDFAIPKIQEKIEDGKTIYDFIKESISIEIVGLESTYIDEGFFMLPVTKKDIDVYQYKVSFFTNSLDKFRTINTKHITRIHKSVFETLNSIKSKIIDFQSEFSNPATYFFHTQYSFPIEDSLLPISQRLFLTKIYKS